MEASPRKVVFLSRRRGLRRERRRGDADEARIAASLKAGEAEAIGAVAERYRRFVRGFLVEILLDEGSAEDVLQQVMLEVWRRGPEYDPGRSSLLTWIMTIARSRAIDERRRRRPEPLDPTTVAERTEPETDPELERVAERWRVAELLSQIPPEEATVLRLRFYEGLPQTEIAERTGAKLGTVKTRMVRALGRLREMIGEEEGR